MNKQLLSEVVKGGPQVSRMVTDMHRQRSWRGNSDRENIQREQKSVEKHGNQIT